MIGTAMAFHPRTIPGPVAVRCVGSIPCASASQLKVYDSFSTPVSLHLGRLPQRP